MPKSKNSGNGEKPTPLPRTKMQEDYTPRSRPRESKITLNTVLPAPSNTEAVGPVVMRNYSRPKDGYSEPTHTYLEPYNSRYDSSGDKRYCNDDNKPSTSNSDTRSDRHLGAPRGVRY